MRCDRPACSSCLREASVGYQCVDCVAQGSRSGRRATTVAGAEPTGRVVVVPVLVAVNVIVFAITAAQAGLISNYDKGLFPQWGLWPMGVAAGELWRLFTSGFLHFGPFHLAVNMLALWVIGRDLEQVLGWVRFLVVYLVALLGGSLAVFYFEYPMSMTAGASGAVFGLMGGLAVVLLRIGGSLSQVLTIIALNVVLTFVLGLSIPGHFGGLLFGAVVTAGMVYAPRNRRAVVQLAIVTALVGFIALGILVRDAQFGKVTACTTEPQLSCRVQR